MITNKIIVFDYLQENYVAVNSEEHQNIIDIQIQETFVLAVNDKGQLLQWGEIPFLNGMEKMDLDQLLLKPRIITQLKYEHIIQISTNSSSILALSDNGIVYSWGNDEKETGMLGLGKLKFQAYPTPIEMLSKEYIKYINIGQKHAGAIDTNGNVYLWGSAQNGELGFSGLNLQLVPKKLVSHDILNARKLNCNLSCTAILTMGGRSVLFGTLKKSFEGLGRTTQYGHDSPIKLSPQTPTLIDGLGNLFIIDQVFGEEYLALLTDKQGIYIINSKHSLIKLNSFSLPISQIASSKLKIYGITCDNKNLIEWDISQLNTQQRGRRNSNSSDSNSYVKQVNFHNWIMNPRIHATNTTRSVGLSLKQQKVEKQQKQNQRQEIISIGTAIQTSNNTLSTSVDQSSSKEQKSKELLGLLNKEESQQKSRFYQQQKHINNIKNLLNSEPKHINNNDISDINDIHQPTLKDLMQQYLKQTTVSNNIQYNKNVNEYQQQYQAEEQDAISNNKYSNIQFQEDYSMLTSDQQQQQSIQLAIKDLSEQIKLYYNETNTSSDLFTPQHSLQQYQQQYVPTSYNNNNNSNNTPKSLKNIKKSFLPSDNSNSPIEYFDTLKAAIKHSVNNNISSSNNNSNNKALKEKEELKHIINDFNKPQNILSINRKQQLIDSISKSLMTPNSSSNNNSPYLQVQTPSPSRQTCVSEYSQQQQQYNSPAITKVKVTQNKIHILYLCLNQIIKRSLRLGFNQIYQLSSTQLQTLIHNQQLISVFSQKFNKFISSLQFKQKQKSFNKIREYSKNTRINKLVNILIYIYTKQYTRMTQYVFSRLIDYNIKQEQQSIQTQNFMQIVKGAYKQQFSNLLSELSNMNKQRNKLTQNSILLANKLNSIRKISLKDSFQKLQQYRNQQNFRAKYFGKILVNTFKQLNFILKLHGFTKLKNNQQRVKPQIIEFLTKRLNNYIYKLKLNGLQSIKNSSIINNQETVNKLPRKFNNFEKNKPFNNNNNSSIVTEHVITISNTEKIDELEASPFFNQINDHHNLQDKVQSTQGFGSLLIHPTMQRTQSQLSNAHSDVIKSNKKDQLNESRMSIQKLNQSFGDLSKIHPQQQQLIESESFYQQFHDNKSLNDEFHALENSSLIYKTPLKSNSAQKLKQKATPQNTKPRAPQQQQQQQQRKPPQRLRAGSQSPSLVKSEQKSYSQIHRQATSTSQTQIDKQEEDSKNDLKNTLKSQSKQLSEYLRKIAQFSTLGSKLTGKSTNNKEYTINNQNIHQNQNNIINNQQSTHSKGQTIEQYNQQVNNNILKIEELQDNNNIFQLSNEPISVNKIRSGSSSSKHNKTPPVKSLRQQQQQQQQNLQGQSRLNTLFQVNDVSSALEKTSEDPQLLSKSENLDINNNLQTKFNSDKKNDTQKEKSNLKNQSLHSPSKTNNNNNNKSRESSTHKSRPQNKKPSNSLNNSSNSLSSESNQKQILKKSSFYKQSVETGNLPSRMTVSTSQIDKKDTYKHKK